MKLVIAVPVLAVVALGSLVACTGDDGSTVRESGGVQVIGPPPPGGGGSVSAIGSGCTTKGATTKTVSANVLFELDEHLITPPGQITAGVNRIVVKNFGSDPHEIVITQADSVEALPVVDGAVDLDALPSKIYWVQAFAGNTICEGAFDLPAGTYVAFSNLEGPDGTDFEQGMAATFVVA